jgi:hypothetical protein
MFTAGNVVYFLLVVVVWFLIFVSMNKYRRVKTTWLIRRGHEWSKQKDSPVFLVFRKTGMFGKEYIGHGYDMFSAEKLTGKHTTQPWATRNKIILKNI